MVLAQLAELTMLTNIGQMLKEDLVTDPISGTVGSYRSQSLFLGGWCMVGVDLPLSSLLESEALGLNPSKHSLGAMIALPPHCYTFHLGPVV